MAITQNDLNNWFSYHPPTPEQLVAYNDIRQAAKIYAETVNKHVPDSADKTAAIRKIRESVMASNLALACYVETRTNPTNIAEVMYGKDGL